MTDNTPTCQFCGKPATHHIDDYHLCERCLHRAIVAYELLVKGDVGPRFISDVLRHIAEFKDVLEALK